MVGVVPVLSSVGEDPLSGPVIDKEKKKVVGLDLFPT